MMTSHARLLHWLPLAAALLLLLGVYLPTMQTVVNGSEHYFMIDVGETQIVLNVWGTLHATGYPHYVMTGNAIAALLRALGIDAVTAPALVSLIWGMAALALVYALMVNAVRRPLIAAGVVVLAGLARTVWIHQVIAEIYSFGLLIAVGLLALALWQPPIRGRLYWLALLGGIGVAHHRAIAMMIPALIYAVHADLRAQGRRLPRTLAICLLLGVIGFLPYAYLLLRANAGAAWVYGEPGTLAGLWDQFTGREASRFIGTPGSVDGLLANIAQINAVLITDLTAVGLALGLIGLVVGALAAERRHLALTLILNGAAAYGFHCLFYTDILSALILPVIISVAFGWLLLADAAARRVPHAPRADEAHLVPTMVRVVLGGLALWLGVSLYGQNRPFIDELTQDATGVEAIALARAAPPGSALMLAWGPRHFAVGFARDVMGDPALRAVELVDHKADFAALSAQRPLITPAYTFYRQPVEWWQAQLGQPVYLRAAAPELVEIGLQPQIADDVPSLGARAAVITYSEERIVLTVDWQTDVIPTRDLSVFVHLLADGDTPIAQADQSAPVYGWRPLTSWRPREIVRDIYVLPRLAEAQRLRYGLYTQRDDGSFENILTYDMAVEWPS